MGVRAFLRGGYSTLRETTVISHRGRPLFTVIPFGADDAIFKETSQVQGVSTRPSLQRRMQLVDEVADEGK